jgi:hypothetical protein
MNSPIANLFLLLQAQIASLVDNTGDTPQPLIRHIDQDFGQLEDLGPDKRPPVAWPCVLIDIDDITWKSMSNNGQSGVGNEILRLGFTPHDNSNQVTPIMYKQKALRYYDIEYALHLALQGWCPDPTTDIFGSLDRVTARTEKREDFLRVREIIYSLGFDDYSTQNSKTKVPATLNFMIPNSPQGGALYVPTTLDINV